MTDYRYKPAVLGRLAAHGIVPRPFTPPELIRDFLNDLYRYELRRLRDRLRTKQMEKQEYYHRVVDIRLRYPLLSLKMWEWTE